MENRRGKGRLGLLGVRLNHLGLRWFMWSGGVVMRSEHKSSDLLTNKDILDRSCHGDEETGTQVHPLVLLHSLPVSVVQEVSTENVSNMRT